MPETLTDPNPTIASIFANVGEAERSMKEHMAAAETGRAVLLKAEGDLKALLAVVQEALNGNMKSRVPAPTPPVVSGLPIPTAMPIFKATPIHTRNAKRSRAYSGRVHWKPGALLALILKVAHKKATITSDDIVPHGVTRPSANAALSYLHIKKGLLEKGSRRGSYHLTKKANP